MYEVAVGGRYLDPSPARPVSVPAESPPESLSRPVAHDTPRAAAPPRAVAWRQDDEPDLAEGLRSRWSALPVWRRRALVAVLVLGAAVFVWRMGGGGDPPPTDAEIAQEAAAARTAWAAARRQAPLPLAPMADGTAFATGSLEPGDAETAAGRYVDFLTYALDDSVEFAVVATSADFTPDVSVRTPDGRRVAASVLLGTDSRAEVIGLQGPGSFEIAVTSASPEALGSYEVSASPRVTADTLRAEDALRADSLGGGQLRAGRYVVAYSLLVDPDEPVVLDVVSPAFEPRITLLGPAGEIRQQRTLERGAAGDSLFGAVLRFRPGWDLPYTILVSSEEPEASGPFALELRTVKIKSLSPTGRAVTGQLGEQSWLRDGRYVDAYRFRVGSGEDVEISVQSEAFAPAIQLWREETRGVKKAAESLNREERSQVSIDEGSLDPGTYVVEVTSAEAGEAGVYPAGRYALRVTSARPEPAPSASGGSSSSSSGGSATGFTSGASGSATGSSPDGDTFTVSVSGVAVSYIGGRTRIQLSVSVRSVDYSGPWAPWRSFARKSALMDAGGRQYRPAPSESAGTGVLAEPGGTRRGRLVFYADGTQTNIDRLVFSAPLGGGASVPITLNLPR